MNKFPLTLRGAHIINRILLAAMLNGVAAVSVIAAECQPTGDDVRDRLCLLQNHYLQGHYDQVVGELAIVQGALRPEEYFYLGISFYQMMQETHSPSMRCDYRQKARDVLRNYLDKSHSDYIKTGTYGSALEMAQIYAATRIMDDTGKMTGCLENGMTAMEMELTSGKFARNILERIELKSRPGDAAADAPELKIYDQGVVMWDTIQEITRTFVSSASYLETEISKKQTQCQAATYNTGKIKESLSSMAAIDEKDGRINSITLMQDADVQKVDEWLKGVELQLDNPGDPLGFKQKFNKALGEDMTPEKYAQLQKEKISSAKGLVARLAFGASIVQQEVNRDSSAIGRTSQMYGGNASATLNSLRAKWREYGNQKGLCRNTNSKPWYCN